MDKLQDRMPVELDSWLREAFSLASMDGPEGDRAARLLYLATRDAAACMRQVYESRPSAFTGIASLQTVDCVPWLHYGKDADDAFSDWRACTGATITAETLAKPRAFDDLCDLDIKGSPANLGIFIAKAILDEMARPRISGTDEQGHPVRQDFPLDAKVFWDAVKLIDSQETQHVPDWRYLAKLLPVPFSKKRAMANPVFCLAHYMLKWHLGLDLETHQLFRSYVNHRRNQGKLPSELRNHIRTTVCGTVVSCLARTMQQKRAFR